MDAFVVAPSLVLCTALSDTHTVDMLPDPPMRVLLLVSTMPDPSTVTLVAPVVA